MHRKKKKKKWWIEFLPTWNQKSIIPDSFVIYSDDLRLHTDASGIGFGAVYGKHWIQEKWPPHLHNESIDYKELFAIVASCLTWGNSGLESALSSSQTTYLSPSPGSLVLLHPRHMSLARKLFLTAAQSEFSVSLKHIPGKVNSVADALSRFLVHQFRSLAPRADQEPTTTPHSIWEI